MKKLYSFLTGIVLVILVLWGISHQIEASMNTKNSDKLVIYNWGDYIDPALITQFEEETFDLVILDMMLPSVSGLDVLKEIRKTSQIPVMILTALDDEYTQLVSFNHLISDYVTKPFSPLILVKRIENILITI